MKIILASVLVLVAGLIPLVFAGEATDWCINQPGTKDTESLNQCIDGYSEMKQKNANMDNVEYEGEDTSNTQNEEIQALKAENLELKNEISQLKEQIENLNKILMEQINVIMTTLANMQN